jgi:hypothetical protein
MPIQTYESEATAAAAELDQATAKWSKASWLSAEGQKAAVDEATAKYQAKVDGIKARAEADLTAQRSKIVDGLSKIKAAEAKADRDLLGPEIQYRLIERRMAKATPEELVAWLDWARDDWEAEVIAQLGESLLPNVAIDDSRFRAVSEFRARVEAKTDPTIDKLQAALNHVDASMGSLKRLDPVAWQRDVRVQFRI